MARSSPAFRVDGAAHCRGLVNRAAGRVRARPAFADCVAARADADVPARITEEILALVDKRAAVRAVLDATTRLAGEPAAAGVDAGLEIGALAAPASEATAPVNAFQIHLDAGVVVTGPGG